MWCSGGLVLLMISFAANLFLLKLSFQEWTQQVQDMLNTKKFGDIAFRDKDFKNAIDYYSKVPSSFSTLGHDYCHD